VSARGPRETVDERLPAVLHPRLLLLLLQLPRVKQAGSSREEEERDRDQRHYAMEDCAWCGWARSTLKLG
jgi:hypothetical protein